MSMDITSGRYFRGFLASDALATDTAIPLFDENGVATTLAAGERPIIYESLISNGATAAKVTIYADTNGGATYDAGEELIVANLAINAYAAMPNGDGYIAGRQSNGAAVNKLRAVASANSVGTVITLVGQIIKS